jgi:hypothetical protein
MQKNNGMCKVETVTATWACHGMSMYVNRPKWLFEGNLMGKMKINHFEVPHFQINPHPCVLLPRIYRFRWLLPVVVTLEVKRALFKKILAPASSADCIYLIGILCGVRGCHFHFY